MLVYFIASFQTQLLLIQSKENSLSSKPLQRAIYIQILFFIMLSHILKNWHFNSGLDHSLLFLKNKGIYTVYFSLIVTPTIAPTLIITFN